MKMSKLFCSAALAFGMASGGFASEDPLRLGEMFLGENVDVGIIKLGPCDENQNNEPVSSLRLRVLNTGATIDHVKVTFGNGDVVELQVAEHFDAYTRSRWINLPGQERCIRKIFVRGHSDDETGDRDVSKLVFVGQ